MKNALENPDGIKDPIIIQHTLRSKPKKQMHEWDVCEFAKKIYLEPNAGGKSVNSEAFSTNILNEIYGVSDIIPEMEVEYIWYNYKRCDYLCTIYGNRVGVSVTRAMAYPNPSYFTLDDAERLLKKKINGLLVAREGVCTKYDFKKCILHIWCQSEGIAKIIQDYYNTLDYETRDDIIIMLTVTEQSSSSQFIYYDKHSDFIRERIQRLGVCNDESDSHR